MSTIDVTIDMPITGRVSFTRDFAVDQTFDTEQWQEVENAARELDKIAGELRRMWQAPPPCRRCGARTPYGKIHFHNNVPPEAAS